MTNENLDELLGTTLPRSSPARRPAPEPLFPRGWFAQWARSQVATYRTGLVLTYLFMIYFGYSCLTAGVPVFDIAAPEGWTPIWAPMVMIGGLIAACGAVRAGSEPVTPQVRFFNWVELVGSTILFLTLFVYAGSLLVLGYVFHDDGRVAVGSGFVALGVHPAIRMAWLTFRPHRARKAKVNPES